MRISDWSSDVCSSDLDIALLVLRNPDRIRRTRRRQCLGLADLARNALLRRGGINIEARLDVGRDPIPDIEIAAHGVPARVIAIAVARLGRGGPVIIEWARPPTATPLAFPTSDAAALPA